MIYKEQHPIGFFYEKTLTQKTQRFFLILAAFLGTFSGFPSACSKAFRSDTLCHRELSSTSAAHPSLLCLSYLPSLPLSPPRHSAQTRIRLPTPFHSITLNGIRTFCLFNMPFKGESSYLGKPRTIEFSATTFCRLFPAPLGKYVIPRADYFQPSGEKFSTVTLSVSSFRTSVHGRSAKRLRLRQPRKPLNRKSRR